jgi:hypothetical protein
MEFFFYTEENYYGEKCVSIGPLMIKSFFTPSEIKELEMESEKIRQHRFKEKETFKWHLNPLTAQTVFQ